MILSWCPWWSTGGGVSGHKVTTLGAVHILRNTGGEGGSSRFITILHRGGVPNLLQYYIGGVLKVYYNITVLKGKWKVIFLFQL